MPRYSPDQEAETLALEMDLTPLAVSLRWMALRQQGHEQD